MEEKTVYDQKSRKRIPIPKEMKVFLDEIEQVCKKHGFSLSHEDSHGNFIVERYDDFFIDWLKKANKGY